MDSLVGAIVDGLKNSLSGEAIIFLISMIPILELRGSILIAPWLLHTTLVPTYIAAVIGNLLPIPFILMFIKQIFVWLKKSGNRHLRRIPEVLEAKAMKRSEQIEKYGYFGLFLFVAIPLPGTGAWTGSLLAVLLGLKPRKSFLFIMLGVLTAGLVMSLVSFGVLNNIISFFAG